MDQALLEVRNEAIAQLTATVEEQSQDMQTRTSEAESRREDVLQQIVALGAFVAEKEGELAMKGRIISELDAAAASMQETLMAKDSEIADARAAVAAVDAELATKNEVMAASQSALMEKTGERDEAIFTADRVQKVLEDTVNDNSHLRQQSKAYETEIASLTQQMQKASTMHERNLTSLKDQLGLYETEIVALESKVREGEKKRKDLRDANCQYEQENARYQKSKMEWKEREEESTRKAQEWESERQGLILRNEQIVAELLVEADNKVRIAQLAQEHTEMIATLKAVAETKEIQLRRSLEVIESFINMGKKLDNALDEQKEVIEAMEVRRMAKEVELVASKQDVSTTSAMLEAQCEQVR